MIEKDKLKRIADEGSLKYKDESLEYLKRFAEVDSGSMDVEGNKKVVEIIEELLNKIEGIKTEKYFYEGYGYNVVARVNENNPNGKIIISAHMDTVFKKGDCNKHPFHIEGDKVYGLGIIDCKAGIVTAIEAVRIMKENDMLPDHEICFIFNCDEEIGSPTAYEIFKKEKEGARMAFVFEPSRLEDGIITNRKGCGDIVIDVKGRKAHSGVNYLDGRSAIMEVAHRMMLLYEENINERGIQFNVGEVKNDDPSNVVSGHATAEVSVRVANKDDMDTVREIVKKVNDADPYIPDTVSEVSVKEFYVPMERNKANVALYELVKYAGSLMDYELKEQSTGGSSDANKFSYMGIPVVDAMGPYMYEIHSTNEHMSISSIERRMKLFCMVLGVLNDRKLEY